MFVNSWHSSPQWLPRLLGSDEVSGGMLGDGVLGSEEVRKGWGEGREEVWRTGRLAEPMVGFAA